MPPSTQCGHALRGEVGAAGGASKVTLGMITMKLSHVKLYRGRVLLGSRTISCVQYCCIFPAISKIEPDESSRVAVSVGSTFDVSVKRRVSPRETIAIRGVAPKACLLSEWGRMLSNPFRYLFNRRLLNDCDSRLWCSHSLFTIC